MTGSARAIGYPTNRLLAVIDDPKAAAAALAALKAAGFADRDLEVLRGEEGADRMDGTGQVSGWLGRLRRAFDFTLMDQLVDFAAYERALRDGRAVVTIHVHGDAPKEAAHQVLKQHGGHFINYYGRFATEELDLWHGPEPDIPGYLRR
jgi:predicted O-methyltransferase YrrM